MSTLRFEWDEAKNRSNQRKHAVGFEEAVRVFLDRLYVSVLERIAEGEERWQTFGVVKEILLLMVAHTVLEESTGVEVIRVISARKATPAERRIYEDEDR